MGRHSSSLSVRRPWVRAAMGATVGVSLLVMTPTASAGALSLPGIEGIPSISVGPQPLPESSFTTIREAEPGQPTVVIVGGTDDQDSLQQLARIQSQLPPGVGIKTINSPQSVAAGWDGIFVIGTGAYTYEKSLEAGVAAAKAAILASGGSAPVKLVGYSQGATIAELAIKQLAAEGTLPPGTTLAVYGGPNTPNTGLANWGPAFTPGLPSGPVDVTDMPVPTEITNLNTDTWAANVSSNPLVAIFYLAPGSIVHGKGYSAEELERWQDTGTVTQIGDNTTLIVLHPKTAGGADMNPWFHAANILLNEAGLPELEGPLYEALNWALNTAAPLGESGQPTTIVGIRIPTVNELTQPFADLTPTSIPQFGTTLRTTEQSNDAEPQPAVASTPTPEPAPVQVEESVQPEVTPVPAPSVTDSSSDESVNTSTEQPVTVEPSEDSSSQDSASAVEPSGPIQGDSADNGSDTSDSSDTVGGDAPASDSSDSSGATSQAGDSPSVSSESNSSSPDTGADSSSDSTGVNE